MEKRFTKSSPSASVNQRMRSKNLVQPRKRFARGKEKTASRKFQPLFLQVGLNVADRAVSKAPCLFLHPRQMNSRPSSGGIFLQCDRAGGIHT